MPDGADIRERSEGGIPDAVGLPSNERRLVQKALDLIEKCRATSGIRAAYARQLNALIETGQQDGTKSLINMLHSHIDRLSSYLFSPTDLRFMVDFNFPYPKLIYERGQIAAQVLTRDWQDTSTDMIFAQGVFESLKYGAALLKQWPERETPDGPVMHRRSLVMPWMFGVFREDVNDLARQPAMCETALLSLPEVWRRISHMRNARDLFDTIKRHSNKTQTSEEYNSFFHQVLSTSGLNTGNTGMTRPTPGGIVMLNNDPNYAIVGPGVDVDLVRMHELWVWDRDGYSTIQIIEPDILIEPQSRRVNLLAFDPVSGSVSEDLKGAHPYTLIQPNQQSGYLWGRSEVADLTEPQGLLSTWASDARRLIGQQIDKVLGIITDGNADEAYDQFRTGGFLNLPPGSQINDLTPKFPAELPQMMDRMMAIIDQIGGFDNMLSGKGESGVRAGNHANMLIKTASPRLRDRSLLVERQCAMAADLWLRILEAKDARNYWTDGSTIEAMRETTFLLDDLPDDRRVQVDSHSGSPIFQDDHQQLIAFGIKAGIVDPHSAIDDLPFPHKDLLHARLKEREEKEAAMMKELVQRDPEAVEKILSKKKGGH